MPVRIMSDAELIKFEVLRDVDHERMPARAAALLLGLSERQVWRLLKAYRLCGADGLISKKRGQPSNRKTPGNVRSAVMAIVRKRYADFGPTLAAEKLREVHDLNVSRETLRAWMIADGLWQDRKKRRARVHQPRYRRDCVGELIQIDGSDHRWFEDRGPMCTLLVYVDDATSRLMHLRFVESESTFAYFSATQNYLEAHGKPPANPKDLHRPMTARDSLEDAFTWRVERTLSQALTLQYDKIMFILDPTEEAQAASGKRVTVVDYPDGRLAIRYQGADLPYRTFDKIRHVKQASVVDNKRLGPMLATIRQRQQLREPEKRSGPRRRDQAAHMFSVG
jgi:hypothetical protein